MIAALSCEQSGIAIKAPECRLHSSNDSSQPYSILIVMILFAEPQGHL